MTTDVIEDAVVSAARAKGYQLNSATMMIVACDLAGSSLAGDLIKIPGKGSLSLTDYLRDLHDRAPSGFSKVQQPDKPADERTISELRRKRSLDSAWHDRRAKASGLTLSMMNEIAATRGEDKRN
ncbi:hypothetical protein M2175_004578 [Bradyrhizobium elkanii]|uniref:hypothetical protein n=1 Tax=Bradyrhizobium TaxID=374 RepID=UPI002166CAEF|nr:MULTISPECIES: hypothetical protein [Bradyrhizobium]MCS3929547.1 hypothetical protein [Bradyrhizobium elkanii]MCS3970103.1 hypothetical protein [Bradyrhizobium japonicum]